MFSPSQNSSRSSSPFPPFFIFFSSLSGIIPSLPQSFFSPTLNKNEIGVRIWRKINKHGIRHRYMQNVKLLSYNLLVGSEQVNIMDLVVWRKGTGERRGFWSLVLHVNVLLSAL